MVRVMARLMMAFGIRWNIQKLLPDDEEVFEVEIFTRLTEPIHAKYDAKQYGGAAALILARDTPLRQNSGADPRAEWNKFLTGPVEVYEVPGDHGAVHKEPYVRDVAETLASCMAAAERSANTAGPANFVPLKKSGLLKRDHSFI